MSYPPLWEKVYSEIGSYLGAFQGPLRAFWKTDRGNATR